MHGLNFAIPKLNFSFYRRNGTFWAFNVMI